MPQIDVKVIGDGDVIQTPFPRGLHIELKAIPKNGAVFIRWEGVAQRFSDVYNVCNINPNYHQSIVAVFSEKNTATTQFDESIPRLDLEEFAILDAKSSYQLSGDELIERFKRHQERKKQIEMDSLKSEVGDSAFNGQLSNNFNNSAISEKLKQNSFKLILQTKGLGEGVITSDPDTLQHPVGSSVVVSAIAAKGSKFKGWSGDLSGTYSKARFVIDGPKTVIAEFVRMYPLTVSVAGKGSVHRSIDVEDYEVGTAVSLEAIPAIGSRFVRWQGDAMGMDAICTIEMNGSRTVVAEFEQITYPIYLKTEGSGEGQITINPNATQHLYGADVKVCAVAAKGSKFKRWSDGASSTDAETKVKINGPKTVTAEFVRVYSLTVSCVGKGQVTRSVTANEYEAGSAVTLTAIPEEGHEFVQWQGAATGAKPVCTLVMNTSKVVKAEFHPLPMFSLKVTHTGTGRGTVLPNKQEFWKGSRVELEAKAAAGCVFDGWGGDLDEGLDSVREVTVNSNMAITATFNRVEVQETDIALTFDHVSFFAHDDEAIVFYFTVSNRCEKQIRLELPLAGFVTAQGEEIEQFGWEKGMLDGAKSATLRAGTFRKMGLIFDKRRLLNVAQGEHLHITLLQNKPAQRLTFSYRCTDEEEGTMTLVNVCVEPLEKEGHNDNTTATAQAELAARMQLLEKSLQEALNKLNAPATPSPVPAPVPAP